MGGTEFKANLTQCGTLWGLDRPAAGIVGLELPADLFSLCAQKRL